MSEIRKTHLELSWAESKVTHEGGLELTIAGYTEGGKPHHIVFKTGPHGIGYIAETLHSAIRKYQEDIDAAKKSLRGD